jgi:hypothetical protein
MEKVLIRIKKLSTWKKICKYNKHETLSIGASPIPYRTLAGELGVQQTKGHPHQSLLADTSQTQYCGILRSYL